MRTLVTTLSLSLLGLACSTSASGPRVCSTIGCSDGLLIRVTPLAAWPHGDYRFTVVADGVTTTCNGTLPLPACGSSALDCDGEDVSIVESGCALPASEHAFGDLVFASAPRAVRVQVELGGRPIAARSWTPAYRTLQPNGAGCEPVCSSAEERLRLRFD